MPETKKTVIEFLCEAKEHPVCPRCCCCEMIWHECENCGGEGVSGHDCGEDACCCLYPEDNMPCDICDGEGGWWECLGQCDEKGKHNHE